MDRHPLTGRLLFAGVAWIAAAPVIAAAAPSFPRGPGLYYSPYKLVFVVLSFWAWVKLSSWLDADANDSGLDAPRWNSALLAVSAAGFLVLWGMSWFWAGLFFFWAAVLGAALLYVHYRNLHVAPADRLFTQEHLTGLLHRVPLAGRGAKAAAEPFRVPVRFISRTSAGEDRGRDGGGRGAQVEQSKGYKAAQEMVWEAIGKRATDIHMEPADDQLVVRLRVDGMMTPAAPFSRAIGEAVINIFKVVSNLDITERRKPQDGSFSAQIGRSIGPGEWQYRLVDFRVATAGSVAGEKLVMRILDSAHQLTDLSQVGMPDALRERIRDLVKRPHGMLLVCGPTGSGKTTTLYACLQEIDRLTQNVITIENPVECRLDNVTQIEVSARAGKTFASELRSILRQDPDVIMVGEIRDKETAEIACQAAQTGHLVFSTVHANDAVAAVGRLIDLGVPPFMIASALSAVLAQRLVRRLCAECRVRYKPSTETLKKLRTDADAVRFLYRPPDAPTAPADDEEDGPCTECGGAGYVKRTGIFELLLINDAIRERIRANPDLQAIRQDALKAGMQSLLADGMRLVIDGETSIQELLRVAK